MRAVLVTGGSRRLGHAICHGLAVAGWDIGIHCQQSCDETQALADGIRAMGRKVAIVSAELADMTAAEGLVDRVADALGMPLNGLVNNAAMFAPDTLFALSHELLDAHFRVNAAAPMLISSAFARQVSGGDASIVQLLDQKIDNPNPDFASYTASKHALSGMIAPMAMAFRGRCRVNAVAPGILFPSHDQTPQEFDAVKGLNLSGRAIAIADVVASVRFLLDCAAVNGQTLYADNGQHLVRSERDIMYLSRDGA